jgi:predicted nucleic acid-binding protein
VIAYLDSSVLLRIVLGQPDAWRGWRALDRAVTSELTEVECLRVLDRRRLRDALPEEELAARRGTLLDLLARTDRLALGPSVLARAAEAFPSQLGTLDALHLASALHWAQWEREEPIVFATHDRELGAAARAYGFAVEGLGEA